MLRSTSDVALQIEIAIEYFRSKRLTARISDPTKVAPRLVMLRSNKPEDVAVANKVGVMFPNQQSWGTHLNIAGGAVAKYAKHQANAIQFLEYLASPQAQEYFANGNNEWPAAKGVELGNPALKAMTGGKPFKSETIPISAVGANMPKVQQMLDRVGFP